MKHTKALLEGEINRMAESIVRLRKNGLTAAEIEKLWEKLNDYEKALKILNERSPV